MEMSEEVRKKNEEDLEEINIYLDAISSYNNRMIDILLKSKVLKIRYPNSKIESILTPNVTRGIKITTYTESGDIRGEEILEFYEIFRLLSHMQAERRIRLQESDF